MEFNKFLEPVCAFQRHRIEGPFEEVPVIEPKVSLLLDFAV